MFKYPDDPKQRFIKRVIALSGDHLEIVYGHPLINRWKVPHCKVGEMSYRDEPSGLPHDGYVDVEFLEGSTYLTFYDDRFSLFQPVARGPTSCKTAELWVLGDNRFNSYDSPTWFLGRGGGG